MTLESLAAADVERTARQFLLGQVNSEDLARSVAGDRLGALSAATIDDLTRPSGISASKPGAAALEVVRQSVSDAVAGQHVATSLLARWLLDSFFPRGGPKIPDAEVLTYADPPLPDQGIAISATAEQQGGWVLRGKFRSAPLAREAGWVVLPAASGDITLLVLLNADAPGVDFEPDEKGFGARAAVNGTFTLRNVRIEQDRSVVLSGEASSSLASNFTALDGLFSLAQEIGSLKAALWEARDHLQKRAHRWYDASPGRVRDDPLVLREFGRWWASARAADELFRSIVEALDAGGPVLEQAHAIAVAANYVGRLSDRFMNEIFELLGASIMRRQTGFDRHWRNRSARLGNRPYGSRPVANAPDLEAHTKDAMQ